MNLDTKYLDIKLISNKAYNCRHLFTIRGTQSATYVHVYP